MKFGKIIMSALLVGIATASLAQQKVYEKQLETKIDKVKVFMTGAEVERHPSISLKQGRNKLIFKGISAFADASSIQFTAKQDFRIISMNTEMDFLYSKESNKRVTQLSDSLELLDGKLTGLRNIQDAYNAELNILRKNQEIKGRNANLTVQELKDMADFVQKRTLRIKKDLSDNSKKQENFRKERRRVQAQLTQLNYSESNRSNQIVVIVDIDKDVTIVPTLKYVVSNCGWASLYDVIAKDVSGKIQLVYKGQVFNNTGNDWDYVDLVLSTGNPNMSASAPDLTPWNLKFNSYGGVSVKGISNKKKRKYAVPVQNDYQQIQSNGLRNVVSNYEYNSRLELDERVVDKDGALKSDLDMGRFNPSGGFIGNVALKPKVKYRQLQVSQLASDFNIERKYTIPADSKPYTVQIAEHNLTASFSHLAIPKLDKDAFLLANITGWEDLDLVPGPTKVYFGGNYVGQSEIDTRNVDDTLGLSFGRDAKILITRKQLKEYTKQKVVGNFKKDTYSYEIVVKNNRNSSVQLDLFDQVPVSQHSDITVSVDEVSDASEDETSGELSWDVRLNAGEVKKYIVTFTVKYPKNKRITVKKFRTISSPSF